MADKIILTYQANTDQFNKDIKKATQNVDGLDKATKDVNKTNKETFDSKGVKDYNKEVGNSSKGVGGLLGNLGKMVPVVGAAFSVGYCNNTCNFSHVVKFYFVVNVVFLTFGVRTTYTTKLKLFLKQKFPIGDCEI